MKNITDFISTVVNEAVTDPWEHSENEKPESSEFIRLSFGSNLYAFETADNIEYYMNDADISWCTPAKGKALLKLRPGECYFDKEENRLWIRIAR